MDNKTIICIHHDKCLDGFMSAWIVRKFYADQGLLDSVLFHPGVYQADVGSIPDPTDKWVYLVDFSYPREIVKMIASVAKKVIIIDHHKTACEALAGLDTEHQNITLYLDVENKNSGCGLSWKYFFSKDSPSDICNAIEDRDLWKFSMENTREICALFASHPFDFGVWDELIEKSDSYNGWMDLVRQGTTLLRQHDKLLDEMLPHITRTLNIAGYDIPVANLPAPFVSDAGNRMCAGTDGFAACYTDSADGRTFSLRSDMHRPEAIDVSAVAKQFGGGGHKNAAGFKVPREHPLARV